MAKIPEYFSRSLMPLPINVVLFTKEKDFKRECKRLGMGDYDFVDDHAVACVHTFENMKDHTTVNMVCVDMKKLENKEAHEVIGMLVHEATHLKQRCMQYLGEDEPSKEFEAYSMQHLTEELCKQFFKQNATKRPTRKA